MADVVSLFSARLTNTLDQLAAQLEARAAPAGGPRVLLVPALPGSQLGHHGTPDDVVWFDFGSVRAGRLVELVQGRPIDPIDLFNPVYLQIVLRLQLAGYDVGLHPYDWRRPVRDLGEELSARIRAEGREVHVVAHSYGSLVTRAAAALGTPNLGRVIMLGPPNHGSFAPVQGMRGTHWVLHVLSAIDGRRAAMELAQEVFSTWPSVYEVLPTRSELGGFDLYDPALWPAAGPRPDPDLLRAAPAVQEWLTTSTGQFHVIAGYGYPTVERVEPGDGVFQYSCDDNGDGFVSTGSARLDPYPCYYVRSPHAGMPNHDVVIGAVEDLLARGATDRLSTAEPAWTVCPSSTDADVPEPPFAGRRGDELDASDVRAALAELPGFMGPVP